MLGKVKSSSDVIWKLNRENTEPNSYCTYKNKIVKVKEMCRTLGILIPVMESKVLRQNTESFYSRFFMEPPAGSPMGVGKSKDKV